MHVLEKDGKLESWNRDHLTIFLSQIQTYRATRKSEFNVTNTVFVVFLHTKFWIKLRFPNDQRYFNSKTAFEKHYFAIAWKAVRIFDIPKGIQEIIEKDPAAIIYRI